MAKMQIGSPKLKTDKKRANLMKILVGKCKTKKETNAVEEVNKYYRLRQRRHC